MQQFISRQLTVGLVFLGSIAGFLARADITVSYDNAVTAINGHGNPDGDWNSLLDTTLNLELSLRAQTTIIGTIPTSPNNGAGTFTFPAGATQPSGKATWDFWFTVNTNPNGTGENQLNAFDFYLTYDTPFEPGNFRTPVNILTYYSDNAYGNNQTLNSSGIIGNANTTPGLILANNIAQNAENISFDGVSPKQGGNFAFQLYAVAPGNGANGPRLGEIDMTVYNAIQPALSAPEPSAFSLIGLAGIVFLFYQRRRYPLPDC